MSKIVIAKNNYFLMKDGCFYGPYHSIAEAELNRFSKTSVVYDQASASGQEFIVPEGQGGWYRVELWGAQGGG